MRNRLFRVVLTALMILAVGVSPVWTLSEPAQAAPACTKVAATDTAADTMARACGHRVEDASGRSETGTMYANPDGTRTMEMSAAVQRVRQPDGTFAAADPALQRNADGTWSARASTVPARFAGGPGEPLVTVRAGKRSFVLDWPGPLPEPVVAGDTATYPDVRPGVDLVIRAKVDGFAHVLVVKTEAARSDPALRRIPFALKGSGVRIADRGDEGVEVVGDDGKTLLRSGGAAMWDSARSDERSNVRAAGDAARTADVSTRVDGGNLILQPDPAALATAKLPLFIDPDWSGPPGRWAYASNNNSNNDLDTARVGRSPTTGVLYRGYWEFPMSSAGKSLHGARIISSSFSIKLWHSYSCQPSPIYMWRGGAIASSPRTAWAPGLDRFLDEKSAAANKDDCYTDATPTMTFDGWLADDVQIAANQGWGTYTVALSAAQAGGGGESTTSRWKRFFPNTAAWIVHYNKPPAAPAAMRIDPSYACGPTALRVNAANGLTLRANLADPDGDLVAAQWEVTGIPAQYAPADSARAAAGSFTTTIPAAAFTDGGSYTWRVRGNDGTDAGAWGSHCAFIVDNSIPGSPAATSAELALGTGLLIPDPPATAVRGRASAVTVRPATGDENIAGYLIGVGAGADATPSVWVSAGPDGSVTVPVVPVATEEPMNHLSVQARNLTGKLGGVVTWRFKANPGAASAGVAGDATGDGRADVTALADAGNSTSALWRWDTRADGTLARPIAPQDITTTYPTADARTVTGDFDGDGRSDVAVFRQQGTAGVSVTVQRSDGNGLTGTVVKTLDAAWNVNRIKIVAGNFDGDSGRRDDLMAAYDHQNGSYSFRVFRATGTAGTPAFADATDWHVNPVGYAAWSLLKLAAGDFDGDGRADVGFTYQYPSCQTRIWLQHSTGTAFTSPVSVWDSGLNTFCGDRAEPVAGDFDGDGRADLLAVYRYDNCQTGLWTFYGNADRTVSAPVNTLSIGAVRWCADSATYQAGDFDGDGDADLAAVYRCCGPYQTKVFTFASAGRTIAAPVLRAENGIGPVGTGTVAVAPNGRYRIVSVHSGKCLTMPAADAAQLTQQTCTGSAAQQFTVIRDGADIVRIQDGVVAPARCLDVREASTANSAAIQRWFCHALPDAVNGNQAFRVNYVGGAQDVVVSISTYATGKVLDIQDFSTADGGLLTQYPYAGTANQHWRLVPVS